MSANDGDMMVDAIALSSPDGRMSKRARRAAEERQRQALFGDGLPMPSCPQPAEKERLLHMAHHLRELADRGMKPRAYKREAERLEREAENYT